eukprot:s155_g11.t1
MEQTAVTEALYFLFGQDYKGRVAENRNWRGKGYGSISRWSRQQGYAAEEIYKTDDAEALDETYDETGDWEDAGEEDYGETECDEAYYADYPEEEPNDEFYMEAEQQYENAYATYLDARRQMVHLKVSRGFYPVVALADSPMPSSPTSQAPRPPKSKGKGKFKKGRGKSPSTWQNKGGMEFKMEELPQWVDGRTTLMNIVDYIKKRGVLPGRYLFMATNKTFGFGGDASRQADWSVRLPVYINGKSGYMETFVVDGSAPLLVGRPILQALNVQMIFKDGKMSIKDGPWFEVPLGEKGEYLLQLDNGVEQDPEGNNIDFDFITDDSLAAIDNYEDLSNYIDIHEYLATTNRLPPEQALQAEEDGYETAPEEIPADEVEDDDPTAFRRGITDKLIKMMHMSFNQFSKNRRHSIESALAAHEQGRRIFWEVFSGSANLSQQMASEGWLVECFDLDTGWNFEEPQHRRDFLHLLDVTCPDFVWFAPPCTVWSPLQQLNIYAEEKQHALQADRDYQEATYLKMTKRGYQKQQREGRHAGVEQPKNARSWATQTFRSMEGYDANFDQCQYGVTLPDENFEEQYIKKPTRLRCPDERMALDLTRTCQGGHWHLPIEGNSPGVGPRAHASGVYQAKLCYAFYLAIQQIFEYKGHEFTFAVKDEVKDELTLDEIDAQMSEEPEPLLLKILQLHHQVFFLDYKMRIYRKPEGRSCAFTGTLATPPRRN